MIKESYPANWRNLPKDVVKIAVTRTSGSILSPNWDLLRTYKNGGLTWEEFEKRFREEIMGNPEAIGFLRQIKELGEQGDVYLICYEKSFPCHRFILMKMIEEEQGSQEAGLQRIVFTFGEYI